MSQEIVDAVRMLAREKGISEDKLLRALEDALLSAYKKQPGAARYARVTMDPDLGEYRVEELLLPEDLEDQLLDEAEELASGELERRVDPETGEVIIPEAPEIAPERLAEFADRIETRDVTRYDRVGQRDRTGRAPRRTAGPRDQRLARAGCADPPQPHIRGARRHLPVVHRRGPRGREHRDPEPVRAAFDVLQARTVRRQRDHSQPARRGAQDVGQFGVQAQPHPRPP
jgi:hypothetical protein